MHTIRTVEQLASVLQGMRASRKLTQAQLGEAMGLSQARISRLLDNPANVTVDQLLTLLMLFDAELAIRPRPQGGAAAAGSREDAW
ncbi:helix-turn-helix domain-containing protein [Thauera butanivorans]|uniref:helix-turn-helix domain-containing protein n=1 Tax=Thauera butanivorans TaxID=86174 RepID=UPI0008392F5E|nr:helix-turn-helix transcriptional regulator [Thauera butanivorans]